ncbi:hypothetical protein [Streptomyces sp. NPDC002758]
MGGWGAGSPDRSERSHAVSHAPVPGADALLAQIKSLGNLGDVATPVTGLLNTVLKADNGRLSTTEATKLIDAVKQAIADATPKDIADPQAKDAVSAALAALRKSLEVSSMPSPPGTSARWPRRSPAW